MASALEAGIVRLHRADGQVVGGGMLVGPDTVLTCAHVVARALGRADDQRPPADAEMWLDFPLIAPGKMVAARVTVWEAPQPDDTGDVAGLSLAGGLPAGVRAIPLVTVDDLWSHRFRTFGFPPGRDHGVWASGRLRGRQAAGWVQMEDSTATGYPVGPGFSGSPVWDDELDGVVGMAVAAESRTEVRAAFLITAGTIVRAWPSIADQARPPCPYRGLSAFREQDAGLFFGRDEATDRLLGELTRRPLVAVVGPSGSGKSSLVFAGAVPRLRQRRGWSVAAMRPAQAMSPLAALAAALLPVLEPGMSQTQRLGELGQLEAVLADGRLPQVVDRALEETGDERLLLVIDQFEELYTLEPEVARQFVDVIVDAVAAQPEGRNRPLTTVLTLRADYLGQALEHARLARALQDSTLLIGQMTRDQLEQAIVGPLRGGMRFEAGLVERILDDVGEEPGNLPLLEFALTLLWERQEHHTLTHAGYEALGGVDGAIARYAEQVYLENLSAADRELARRLLVQLVEPGPSTGQVRRVARKAELDPTRWQLAQRLATTRLLVAGRDLAGLETVELVHEALIPGWTRLREWVDADHEFRSWQERLRDNVQAWRDTDRDTGALLRGVPLAEAERWLQRRPDDLGPAERQYITASRAFQGRSLRRLRALSGGLALLVVAALVFGVLMVQASRRADSQARLAASRYLVSRAEALEQTRPDLALLLGVAAFQLEDTPEAAARLVVRMASDRRDVRDLLVGHEKPVLAVAFSPTDGGMLASASVDNTIVFWDVARRAQVARVSADAVTQLAFSPDGRVLASGGSLNQVRLWDPLRQRALGSPLRGAPDELLGLSFSPDGHLLAGCGDDEVVLWDLRARTRLARIPTGGGWARSDSCRAGFTSDGRRLAHAAGDKVVTWDIARRAADRAVPVPSPPELFPGAFTDEEVAIGTFAASPTGDVALLSTERSTGSGPFLWDLRRATPPASLPRPVFSSRESYWIPREVAYSSDGRTLAILREDGGTVAVIDVASRRAVRVFTGHRRGVSSITLSPDGRTLAASGADNAIALFQVDDLGALPVTEGRAAFSTDGSQLLTASLRDGIQAWDLTRRTRVGAATALASTIFERQFGSMTFSPDGRFLATDLRGRRADTDRRIVVWDVERRVPLGGVTFADDSVGLGALAPDGRVLALVQGRKVVLWDVGRETQRATLPAPAGSLSLAFSPDGNRLAAATSSPPGAVVLWDVAEPAKKVSLATDGYWESPVFSPDGRWLALHGVAGIELWNLGERRRAATLPGQGRAVFSPDSRLLAASAGLSVAGPPQGVAIWDVGTGAGVATVGVGGDRSSERSGRDDEALAFSRDGQLLVTVGEGGVAMQRFDPSWAERHICQVVKRNMTRQEWDDNVPGPGYRRTCP
jgi:WD40 repeat protein